VPARSPQLRRGLGERALAWVFTGPLGHLYSALADLAVFFVRSLATRGWRTVRRR